MNKIYTYFTSPKSNLLLSSFQTTVNVKPWIYPTILCTLGILFFIPKNKLINKYYNKFSVFKGIVNFENQYL